ncbi:hypothetical protein G3R49_19315 [Shewanella sp. WXL01]|uniref:hypothetical protein n=1 Tax=Shewanella sp. WXL01 TaxID=2709721 RepID=UPI00143834F6|nr:hypothetical protein [Shewanella sp. WXL01]NKF52709.1 hypothetical protein [Shewanella sp. WXL01]
MENLYYGLMVFMIIFGGLFFLGKTAFKIGLKFAFIKDDVKAVEDLLKKRYEEERGISKGDCCDR